MAVSKPLPGAPIDYSHPLLKGLVLWYPFLEGNGGVVRNPVTPGIYPGTFSAISPGSTLSGWKGGPLGGQAVLFDGTDDVITTGVSTPFDFLNTTYTVTGRFRTTSTALMYIFGKIGVSNAGGWGVGVSNHTANKFGVVLKNAGVTSNCMLRASSTTVNDGKWHSFAAVITSDTVTSGNNTCTIYIDGALDQDTVTLSGVTGTGSIALTIAKRDIGSFYQGGLDDLKIYNRGLSAQEAYQLHINPWQMFIDETPFAFNTVGAGATTTNRQYSFVAG